MPAAHVGPDVANLLLTRSPHFFHIVEMFFDRPTRRHRFQNITHFRRRVRAEIGCPTAVLKAHNHHTNLAADQTRCGQKRLVRTRHLDAAAWVGDGAPALAVPGTLCQTDFVLAINAVAVRILRRQVKQAGVLPQATDNHDSQFQDRQKKRSRGVGSIDHQPDCRLHTEFSQRGDEPG